MASNKNIGAKVASIRVLKNLSRAEVAESSGMTEEMIAIIEEGNELPSLAALIKIARPLGVRLGTFLDDTEIHGPVISRKDELKKGQSFSSKTAGSNAYLNFLSLAGDKAERHMEPFIVEIEPVGKHDYVFSSHEGEEFIYVLQGKIELSYGKENFSLDEGDSIYYDSIVKHNLHCRNNETAKILAVVYTPF